MRIIIPALVVAALLAAAGIAPPQRTEAQGVPGACGEPAPGREMDGDEQAMLDRLNSYRAARQLAPLEPARALMAAAQAKASAIGRLPSFTHDDPNRTWEQRLADCGYPVDATFGEVLGCESEGIDALVRSWQESPVHQAVLGNGLFNAAGIARALHPDGYHCWVIDLGSVIL